MRSDDVARGGLDPLTPLLLFSRFGFGSRDADSSSNSRLMPVDNFRQQKKKTKNHVDHQQAAAAAVVSLGLILFLAAAAVR